MTDLTTTSPIVNAPPAAPRWGEWTIPPSFPPVIPGELWQRTVQRLTKNCTDKTAGPRGSCVTLDLVEKRLRRAIRTWAIYAVFRDKGGTCWPSRERVATVYQQYFEERISPRQIEADLRKLRKFKFVNDIKRHLHRAPGKFGERVERAVYGRVYHHHGMWLVRLPQRAKKTLETLPGWGGNRWKSRPAQGTRPFSSRVTTPSPSTRRERQVESLNYSPTTLRTEDPSGRMKDSTACAVESDLRVSAQHIGATTSTVSASTSSPGCAPKNRISARAMLAALATALEGATVADLWETDHDLDPPEIGRVLDQLWVAGRADREWIGGEYRYWTRQRSRSPNGVPPDKEATA